jgi:hypothetical protein
VGNHDAHANGPVAAVWVSAELIYRRRDGLFNKLMQARRCYFPADYFDYCTFSLY